MFREVSSSPSEVVDSIHSCSHILVHDLAPALGFGKNSFTLW